RNDNLRYITFQQLFMIYHNNFTALIHHILTKFMTIDGITFRSNKYAAFLAVSESVVISFTFISNVPITCLTLIFLNNSFAFNINRSFISNTSIIHIFK